MATVKKKGPATAKIAGDPLDLNWRLYQQLGRLLDDMEAADAEDKMTFPQRISAMIAIGRVQKIFIDLRKGDFSVGAGSAVQKYAAAFSPPYAASRGKPVPGSAFVVEPDTDGDSDDDSDDSDYDTAA